MFKILENVPLVDYNTFGINVLAHRYVEFSDDIELREIISFCKGVGEPFFVLSGGSNVILTGNFPGVILHPANKGISPIDDLIVVASGELWDDLVLWSVKNGYYGLENLSHIPGLVGASPIQNIGAYGVEVSDTIEWVEYLDTHTLELKRFSNKECKFGYRTSVFKTELRDRAIIVSVAFRLSKKGQFNVKYGDVRAKLEEYGEVSLRNVRKAIISIRESKLPDPDILPNAGSFFKNPIVSSSLAEVLRRDYPSIVSYDLKSGDVKIPAGWLIEQIGYKGRREGFVGVHEKQALVIVNYGGATAKDIIVFSKHIIDLVYAKFGIMLEREVTII